MERFSPLPSRRWLPSLACTFALLSVQGLWAQDATPPPQAAPATPTLQQATAHLQNADWPSAIHDLERITAAQPNHGQAWFLLAYAVHGSGDLDRAVELHTKASTFPANAQLAFYNLACAQSLRKEIPEAYQALEKAFQAGYSNLIQLQADADLANLRADEGYAAFLAQHSPGGPILPLTYPEQRRMFDFMIGEWDLFQGNNLIGQTSVSFDLNRQVIQSRLAGQSFSTMTYVEKEDLWRQTWMSTNGHHDILEGGLENGMPVMYQKLLRDRPGFIGRATFGNIAENSYDSYWDISPDGGKTWQRQWQGQFRRQTMQRESSKYSLKGMSKEAAQETEQYAFKLGTWDIKARSRTPNGGVTEGVGSSLVYFAEDGQTILDDIAVSFNGGGGFSGTTSRRWSSEKGLWECSWTQVGAQTQPFTAVYDGEAGRMVESFRGQDANGAFSGKLSFYDVSADSLHVRLDYHYDSGVVAEGVWEYIAHRTPE